MTVADAHQANERREGGSRWDADSYHRVSGPLEEFGLEVLDRLPLRGDESVLDAGCGTGRVTAHIVARVPRGRVIAVDSSLAMVERARRNLGGTAEVRLADLSALELDKPVDAILSTATFHWILDHDRLFRRLREALAPGGHLAAQCGGTGNIAAVLAAANEAAALPPFAGDFRGFRGPTLFAGAEETAGRLRAAGFVDVSCRLTQRPVVPEDPRRYLATVTCGPHLGVLPADRRDAFVEAVLERLPEPVTIDYVRLDIDARRPP